MRTQIKQFAVWLTLFLSLSTLPASGEPLKAGIETWAKPGASFDAGLIQSEDHWYLIPDWLAGTWHVKTASTYDPTFSKRLSTFLNETTQDWGTQRDRLGQIWQLDVIPDVNTIATGHGDIRDISLGRTPQQQSDPNSFYYTKKAIQIWLEQGRNIVRREDSIVSFHLCPNGPGVITFRWVESFPNGTNRYGAYQAHKTRAFVPVNFDAKGRDLRISFVDYLRAHNLQDLIPVSLLPAGSPVLPAPAQSSPP